MTTLHFSQGPHAVHEITSAEWRIDTLRIGKHPPMGIRIYGQRIRGSNQPLVLHLHGGAFIGRSPDEGDVIAHLLAKTGAIIISLDYPLAPEYTFPIAVEASHAALAWLSTYRNRTRLAGRSSKVYVAGEEAGGNIAAAVAMVARDRQHPVLSGQILVSPMLNPWLATASMREANAGVHGSRWAEGWQHYLSSPSDADHPYAAPGIAVRLTGLPPTLLLTAIDDPMRDDATAYAQRLRASDVVVSSIVLPAPTAWPCGLMNPRNINAPWATQALHHFQQFFQSTEATHPTASSPAPFSL